MIHRPTLSLRTMGFRLMAAALVTVIVAGTVACTSSSGDGGDGFVAWPAVQEEYRDAVASFPFDLPSGITFPADPEPPGGDTNGRYQLGLGEGQAYMDAEFAWACPPLAALDSDSSTAQGALDEVQRVHDSPGFQAHFQDDGGWQRMMDKTRLGDSADFAQTYGGCDQRFG